MIIDLDGYRIRSGFIARELGVYSLKDGSLSWMFDNPLPFFYLDKKDQRTCHYVYRHVHGLPWQTRSQEKAHPQHMVKPIVDTLYRSCRTPERWLVAYKGGCLEKNLLNELQIPCVNLEDFGCLKDRNIGGYRIESWVQLWLLWSSYTTSTTLSQARNLSVLPMDAVCFTQIFVEKRLVFSRKGLLRYKTNEGMKFVQD